MNQLNPEIARTTGAPAGQTRRGGRCQTIAVASGKGGVGKTWLSITLAHTLARKGKRVLLFDGDIGLANVDIQLGLAPKRDLGSVVAGRVGLREVIVKNAGDTGFDAITGPSGSGSLSTLPPLHLDALMRELGNLAGAYDFVVMDLGAGIDNTVRSLAARADTALIVTTAEPTALTDAYAFIKLLTLRNGGGDVRIVVNMAANDSEGRTTYQALLKACEGFLDIAPPLAGIVPLDRKVPETIRTQAPLLDRHPGSPAAIGVNNLAAGLAVRLRAAEPS
jgi:flagellar biosynthesis protein FlhG